MTDDTTPPGWRLKQLELRAEATDARLEKGADAFAAMRSKWVWFALGLAGSVLAGALAVGRILQRVDDTATQTEKHESSIRAVEASVTEVKVEQVRLRSSVDGLKESIDLKLDRALRADPLGRRHPR